ncbi:hypothetical protein COOONC_22325 [Cooperia oncophora]
MRWQQAANIECHSSDDVDSRGSDGSLKDSAMDEPSCSLAIDDGGTRRARSVTSSRISLFFAKVSQAYGFYSSGFEVLM